MVFLGTLCWLRQVVLMSIWRRSRMLKEGGSYVVPEVLKHDTSHVILPVYLSKWACCWNHSFLSILCSLWVIISLHMHIKRLQAGFCLFVCIIIIIIIIIFFFFLFPQIYKLPMHPLGFETTTSPSTHYCKRRKCHLSQSSLATRL